MSGTEDAGVRAELQGAQGAQVGQHNKTYNVWYSGALGPAVSGIAVGPVVAGEIPQEPPAFQPREDLLADLRAAGPRVSVVYAVTGMRGVGKTQLAAAFARECAAAGWRLVAWVDAQDAGSVLAGLAVVAARLGIAASAGAQDAAVAVRNWLEADGESCLLVLDNAADLGALRRFVPAVGKSRVVVTTTGQAVGARAAQVPVGAYSESEGLAFLAERTGLASDAGARAVAEELGWLPLGLAQAGAVIAAQRLSYAVYLERLRQIPVGEYLTAGPGDAYPRGVAEAVLLSLDTMASDDAVGGVCRAVLDVVAVLSPAGVSRSLLHGAAGPGVLPSLTGAQERRLVDEAIGRLASGSLLSFSGDGDSVTAHRLVMRVVRERAARKGTQVPLGMRACGLLDSVMRSLGEPWENRAATRDAIGQVIALHEHLLPCLDDSPELAAQLLSLRRRALYGLTQLGDAVGLAVEFGRSVLADCGGVLGEDHPDTLEVRGNLANAFRTAGRLDEAIPLHEDTLTDYERILGHTHPDTLESRGNLANAYRAAGRLEEAIPLYEDTLANREQVLGEAHPDTLESRNNLAVAYYAAGRLDEAIPLHEATLTAYERVLGRTHPHTLVSRGNLASAYRAAGRLDEAIPLHEDTLAAYERVLGRTHPHTLVSRGNLASAYRAAGQLDEAIRLHTETLADRERVLGAAHPDTLESRNNLASAYRTAGRLDEAIPLHEDTLAAYERVLGRTHPHTLVSRGNLASAYRAAGRLAEAIPLLEATLAGREQVLGHTHPSTVKSRSHLASAYQEAGQSG